jgi:hypothetical protein
MECSWGWRGIAIRRLPLSHNAAKQVSDFFLHRAASTGNRFIRWVGIRSLHNYNFFQCGLCSRPRFFWGKFGFQICVRGLQHGDATVGGYLYLVLALFLWLYLRPKKLDWTSVMPVADTCFAHHCWFYVRISDMRMISPRSNHHRW